MVQEFNGLGPG